MISPLIEELLGLIEESLALIAIPCGYTHPTQPQYSGSQENLHANMREP